MWIGLNHLKDGRGWQWSDGAPLSLVNFTTGADCLFTPGPRESVLAFVFVKQKMLICCSFNTEKIVTSTGSTASLMQTKKLLQQILQPTNVKY